MSAKCELKAAAKASGKTRYTDVKPCRICGGVLRNTINGSCVACCKVRRRKIYETNIVAERAAGAEYARERRAQDPLEARRKQSRSRLLKLYGMTEEQHREMFAKQKGRCGICPRKIVSRFEDTRLWTGAGGAPNDLDRVDHCHVTGVVRGLLCSDCNLGLGKFQESKKVLLSAARYLDASQTAQAQRAA